MCDWAMQANLNSYFRLIVCLPHFICNTLQNILQKILYTYEATKECY